MGHARYALHLLQFVPYSNPTLAGLDTNWLVFTNAGKIRIKKKVSVGSSKFYFRLWYSFFIVPFLFYFSCCVLIKGKNVAFFKSIKQFINNNINDNVYKYVPFSFVDIHAYVSLQLQQTKFLSIHNYQCCINHFFLCKVALWSDSYFVFVYVYVTFSSINRILFYSISRFPLTCTKCHIYLNIVPRVTCVILNLTCMYLRLKIIGNLGRSKY